MDVPYPQTSHICLVGQKLVSNLQLIQRLLSRNQVTLIEQQNLSAADKVMQSVNVLLLDCSNSNKVDLEILPQLERLKKDFSYIFVIAINGGLSVEQIAMVFKAGASDYFAKPYDLNTIIERIEYFASRSF